MGHCVSRRQVLTTGAALVAAGWSRQSQAGFEPVWVDQRSVGPFVCRATFPLSKQLLAEAGLERLEAELVRVLALRPCRVKIDLLLVRSQREHRRLIRARHPDAPYRRALFYQSEGRSVIYAYRHDDLAIDLRHECTHALLHADLPMVPLWLDEGLAEYFEPPALRRAAGPSHLPRIASDARRGKMMALEELEEKHELAEMGEADYRYAWAWVHFLLHGPPPAAAQLWGTLASLRRYEPPAAMSERVRSAFPHPHEAFLAHFRAWPGVLRAAGRSGVASG